MKIIPLHPGTVVLLAALAFTPLSLRGADTLVYFGTHAFGADKGFSISHFNTNTGALTKPEFLLQVQAPSYFVIHPSGKHLYTCNEVGRPEGAISAYAIEPKTGKLTFLNRKPAGGADTCYVSLDKTGRYALAANYSGGNLCVYAILPDGSLGERTAFMEHTGRSVHPQRQSKAFTHSINISPDNHFALAADLGTDKIFVYRFNEKDGSLQPNDPPSASVAPGSGPRHFRFHPNGRRVYVINELASTVIGFNWDSTKGTLTEFQTISTLPANFKGSSTCAEIDVHPSGKFLYGSNRGHDSLAVFAIDAASGRLTLIEHVPTRGNAPRNFTFDPAGKWLLVTNHDSSNAVVFRVDEKTGKLTQTGKPMEAPYPFFCARFLVVP